MEQLDEIFYEKDHIKSRLGMKTGKGYKLHHYGFLDITDDGNLPDLSEESNDKPKDDPQCAAAAHDQRKKSGQKGSPKDDEPNGDESKGGEPKDGEPNVEEPKEAEKPKDGEPRPDEPEPDSQNIGPECGADGPDEPTVVYTYSYQKLKDRVRWFSKRANEDFEWSKHVNRNCMGLRIIVPGLWVFPELSPAPGDPCPPYDAGFDDGEINGDLSGFSEAFESRMLVAWFMRFHNQGYDPDFFAQQEVPGRAHVLSNLL